jgi:hypothetical protein
MENGQSLEYPIHELLRIRKPSDLAKIAESALVENFGPEWQDNPEVVRHFERGLYSIDTLGFDWQSMSRYQRRELVRDRLRTAARNLAKGIPAKNT